MHSGTTSRNNIQTYYIKKQGDLCNWEKNPNTRSASMSPSNDTIIFFSSKNTGNDVSCIHLHQAPSMIHLVVDSIINHFKWWDDIPIPIHQ